MKTCPFCLGDLADEAAKCRFCGEWVTAKPVAPSAAEPPTADIKLQPVTAPPPPTVCRMCGTSFAPGAVVCLECGYDTRTRRIRPGAGRTRRERRRPSTSILAQKSRPVAALAVLLSLGAAAVTLVKGAAWPKTVLVLGGGAVLAAGAAGLLAAIGLYEIWRSRGQIRGVVSALVGLGGCGVTGAVLLVPLGLLVLHLRLARMELHAANLRQVALAMQYYQQTHGTFPPAAIADKESKPLLSWRVAILPYVEQAPLYNQFKLDEPWDSPHNIKLIEFMPKLYCLPGEKPREPFATRYQVFVGKGAAFEGTKGLPWTAFSDGTSNTLLVAEAAQPVPWTKPDDMAYDPAGPLPPLGDFTGPYAVAFADGSVRFLRKEIDEPTLRALVTRDGNEVIGQLPDFPMPQRPPR
jgi:hypothetical protein